ncbi:folylpolyglutamate synthase/dihydrofolate synthase family protein [Mycoplasmatota bacterium WC44]
MFENMEECLEWLYEPRELAIKFDMSRMTKAMSLFNDPIDYKCIHIAGTNGKGSTVSYLKSALIGAGYNVGTFISPFVVVFNERITFNNQYISDQDFIKYVNLVRINLIAADLEISFFEILTIIAFLYFQDKEVDYAIIETGLGGRLDSTNVINKEVALITNVGLDHMEVLGDNLEQIAKEKLGIVRTNLITSVDSELRPQFQEYCDMRSAELIFTQDIIDLEVKGNYTKFKYKDFLVVLSMLGEHQAKNASLALEALLYLREKKGLLITDEQILNGLKRAFWPGRLEQIGKDIYVDGAHNIDGIKTLVNFIKELDKPVTVIYSCLSDKEYTKMLEILEPNVDKIYFTEFDYPRALNAESLFEVSNHKNKHIVKNYKDTFNYIKEDEFTIFCGSLYFISLVRKK